MDFYGKEKRSWLNRQGLFFYFFAYLMAAKNYSGYYEKNRKSVPIGNSRLSINVLGVYIFKSR